MTGDLRRLLATFSPGDRVRLGLYVVAQLLVSLMDLAGLAIVFPLMQVMLGADLDQGYLAVLHRLAGRPERPVFATVMAVAMVVAFALKAAVALVLQWWSLGFVARLQIATAARLLDAYLAEDYLRHRGRDTAEVVRTVDGAVADAHGKVLGGLLNLIGSVLTIVLVMLLLFAVAPVVSLAALVYFAVVVVAMQAVLARRNQAQGAEALESAWLRSLALINAMQGFREVRMHDARAEFVRRFQTASERNAAAGRRVNFYTAVPKYVLELSSIVGIAVILVAVLWAQEAAATMPTLTLFVAATVRLLPTMSALTTTLGVVRSGVTGLGLTVAALGDMADDWPGDGRADAGAGRTPIRERRSGPLELVVDDVSFRYPDGPEEVLTGISLRVPPGTSLALCGASGSGKTTLVDIILGLIRPDRGSVTYGGAPTADRDWFADVAYVPQDVYLVNDSLAANVAFGVPVGERDDARVREALSRAQLDEVVAGLPEGIESLVGEAGSRLSGGQRQRVGIARALYRDPLVIVFDEATSALDNETEEQVGRTIRALSGDVTSIIVAHRLSTVRHVDQLAFLEDGRIAGLGGFTEVRHQAPAFERMVQLGRLDDAPPPAPHHRGTEGGA